MNNIKTVTTYIALTVAMMLLITVMMIQFLRVAFPKDPVMEAKIPIIEQQAEKRAKAIKQLQIEYMEEHH
ncbi:hypothetical protein ACIGLI_07325 [Bacillus subtilis]|uniref:Uncharacterized protein n=2 Tax=Bacillus TaxID=1386 RepID=A0ABT9DIJ2_9BACI|nr:MULTISPECIES: hypothetical protein [Bacillus]ASZ60917.1 hypothetical protein CLD04_06960 [Bacillus subtilis]AWX21594.1 hypothetical protein CXF51_07235 [Bacillus subtilis subsp. subtilis]AYK56513.1 hypothetical protein D9C10_04565 [Bacillus subtilis subsp. subtilis]MBE0186108.1 hypothetical protein [Bacillus subtilis]MBJ3768807.1 hypothetical protein [Bacillus subtilis]